MEKEEKFGRNFIAALAIFSPLSYTNFITERKDFSHMTPLFTEATYMALFPVILCMIYYKFFPVSKTALLGISIPWKLTSGVLSILYAAMSSFTEILKEPIPLFFKIMILVLCCVSCFFLILRAGIRHSQTPAVSYKKIGKTPVYAAMIPITLLSLFVISGCYPGVFSTDSASNWADVATNSFSNWHPVTYLYILKVIQRIFGNPFPLLLFQTALWLIASQYALSLIETYTPVPHGDIYYTIFSFITFSSYRALGNIEKDTLWNIALFMFCLHIYDFIRSKAPMPWYKILSFLIAACMTATVRHMGNIIAVVSLLAFLIYEGKQHKEFFQVRMKQLVLILAASVLIPLFLINLLGNQILNMIPNENYVKYSVPIAMAGAVAAQEKLEEDDIQILEQIMPLEKWQSCYDKYFADSLSRTWGAVGEDALKFRDTQFQKKLIRLNAKFLFRYPITYLTAYFDITSILWEMGTPADGYEWIPITIYSSPLETYAGLSNLQIKPTFSTGIQQTVAAVSDKIPVWSSICWRGGFALFILITCSCLLIKKKRSCELFALIPALLLTGVLFLANPSQDPRYIDVYHMLMCFFLMTASY